MAETNRHIGHADIVFELIDASLVEGGQQLQTIGQPGVVAKLPEPAGVGGAGVGQLVPDCGCWCEYRPLSSAFRGLARSIA